MPRKPRIEYADAIYHIMSRGNRQGEIFWGDGDCDVFLETLGQACSRTGWIIHGYVLMVNHYHLLLETPEPNLSIGMKWLQSTYTQRFNRHHSECGHLFQGRYKALLIDPDDDIYFRVVSNYIHLNPARAKQIKLRNGSLIAYPWSSFPLYANPRNRPEWLCVDRVLGCWGFEDTRSGRLNYRRTLQTYAEDMSDCKKPGEFDPDWLKIRRGWFWGSKKFEQALLDRLEGVRAKAKSESLNGQAIRMHNEQQALKLKAQGLKVLDLTEADLATIGKGAFEKRLLIWLIKSHTSMSNAWVSEQLYSGHPSNVAVYARSIKEAKDRKTAKLRNMLLKKTNERLVY